MTVLQTPKAILFLDFDGTVTRRDAVDAILETFADSKWLTLEAEWRAGQMGSRDCLRSQMALVRATRKQLDALLDEIEVDEGLAALLEMCAAHEVQTHIISDGFDYCIGRILARAGNGSVSLISSVCASHLELDGHVWRTEFPFFHQSCGHGCATCKPALMRLINCTSAPAIFVGDGLSDQYAVESAEVVFAKNELATHCRECSIEYSSYNNLEDVATHIKRWLDSRMFVKSKKKTRASA